MNASQPAIARVKSQAGDASLSKITATDGVSVTCYENEVPPFVDAELERLYGSAFSSLTHYRVYGGADNASTYVVRNGKDITTLLLFRREGRHIRVINEWIPVDDDVVIGFANHVFNGCESVDTISFHAVEATIDALPFPFQRFYCTDDSVVALPDSADEYLAQLGKATRKNIRRHMNRLKEKYPSFRYAVYDGMEANEQHVRDIIKFNRIRMANKNKVSGIDAEEEERMLEMVRAKGFVGVATIDGRVCAGAITCRFGENYFSYVRTHDPQYDDDRLGLVCGYLIISECIARGGKTFHFLWGREEHKSIFLGAGRDLDHLTVYRSRMRLLANGSLACRNALTARVIQARRRLQDAPPDSFLRRTAAVLRRLVHRARNLKHKSSL